jgi:transcriptional regulator with XRE-family HTH domain
MGTTTPSSFGELLRQFRLAAGLTQEELAARAGLSARGLSDLERGARRKPHPASFRRVVAALQLNEVDRGVLDAARAAHPAEDLPTHATELLLSLTSFVGRERELGRSGACWRQVGS